MRWLFTLIKILLFAVFFIFALQNTAVVNLQLLYLWAWQVPLIVVLMIAFATGLLLGLLLALPRFWRSRAASQELHANPSPGAAPVTALETKGGLHPDPNPSTFGKDSYGV